MLSPRRQLAYKVRDELKTLQVAAHSFYHEEGAHLPAVPAGGQASQQASIQQVICAVDLSAHSENVLDWAARLAGSFDARLFLVHAAPALTAAEEDYYKRDWRAELASGARDQLDRLQQSVGTKAEQLIVAGDVPHAVCAQAEELGADVLVIGRSSESGLLGRLRTNAYAQGQRIGFGHLGAAPAQIIVKRVVSLKIMPVKASE